MMTDEEKNRSELDMQERKEFLCYIHGEIAEVHRHRRDLYEQKSHAAEMIIASWAFIFAGIVGLYQADMLNKYNIQQVVLLLAVMFCSIGICVLYCMLPRIEDDPPEPNELWDKYKTAAAKGNEESIEKACVVAKEQVVQAYIDAEAANKKRLSRSSSALGFAALLIVVELILVILFVVFKNLRVVI